jgi:hypothetical protein
MYNRKHRIGTLENILDIRTELSVKSDKPGKSTFKIWRNKGTAYIFDGVVTKDELIEEANRKKAEPLKFLISNNKEHNLLMVDYLRSLGHEAEISTDGKSYINNIPAGDNIKSYWDDFYMQNNILKANNVCIVKTIDDRGRHGGLTELIPGYGVTIRYNYTSVEIPDMFFSTSIQDTVNYARTLAKNKNMRLCCSFEVSDEKAVLEANIHPWGVSYNK